MFRVRRAKSFPLATLLGALVLGFACTAPPRALETGSPEPGRSEIEVVSLREGLVPLRDRFRATAGRLRCIALLSPT